MADNVIRVNVTTVAPKSISIQGSREQNYINATGDTSAYNAQLAKNWAIGEGKIQGIDYSSKHYAGVAKEKAELSSENLNNVQEIVSGFGEAVGNATNELAQVKNDAVVEISNLNTSVIEGIETASNEAIAGIEGARVSAVADVATNKNTAINEIKTIGNTALSSIETKGQEQIKNIEKTGFFMENDKLFFINSKGEVEEFSSGGGTLNMFDTVLKDHILTYEETKGLALQGTWVYKEAVAGSRYGYPTFYEKCVEEKANATATETTLGDNTITMYINANGHQFYDIADKDAIDAWYNTYGRAWMYGVDTENERIFLPRNSKYFRIGDESTVGTNQDAGLPNITGYLMSFENAFSDASGAISISGTNGGANYHNSGSTNMIRNINFNASRSNSIYGNSDTVELDSVNMLLYICVGNTESEEALTNVTEITTSENDTLPWGYHFYSGELLEAPIGYIESLGQWNDGSGLYAQFYSKAVNKLGEAFAGGYIKEVTETYDDYDLVINQTDMTFRLPLLDGSESLPSERYDTLTWLATGSVFTAPANGWYYVYRDATAVKQFISIIDTITHNGATHMSASANDALRLNYFAKKGEQIKINYSGGTANRFEFIYAQGNGSLYFKVANAVQNLELLNAGEVLEAVNNVVPNNSALISSYAMPSNKYIDLTLGASGATYTAPANGFVALEKKSGGSNTYANIYVLNSDKSIEVYGQAAVGFTSGSYLPLFIPVFKGSTYRINYTASGSTTFFRFIYAEGEQ
jgi:hypothetical protein